MQLSAGIVGGFGSMCSCAGYADCIAVRGLGQMEFWHSVLRHLGFVRCSVMHRVDSEFVCHLCGSILGHYKAARIRCQKDAPQNDVMCGLSLAGCCLHLTATAVDPGQRTLHRRRSFIVRGVPEFWLSNLCHIGLVLHSVGGHAIRLLSNISGGTTDSNGRETSANTTGKHNQRCWLRQRRQICNRSWWWHRHRITASKEITVSISQRTKSIHNVGHYNVSVYHMLVAIFYISFSSSILGRKSSSSTDTVFAISVVGLCQLFAESNYLRNLKQRLPKTVSGNTVFPMFQFKFNDARGLLSQSIWGAGITACGAGW